jgi:hypothetical protein
MGWTYPPAWEALRHPWVRMELLGYLDEVADPDLTKLWRAPSLSDEAIGIDQVIHFLFDDHEFAAGGEVGAALLDADESRAVRAVAEAIDAIVAGNRKGDDAYFLDHPLWPQVEQAAAAAAQLLRRQGEPAWSD